MHPVQRLARQALYTDLPAPAQRSSIEHEAPQTRVGREMLKMLPRRQKIMICPPDATKTKSIATTA
jgi:hypothetical protein